MFAYQRFQLFIYHDLKPLQKILLFLSSLTALHLQFFSILSFFPHTFFIHFPPPPSDPRVEEWYLMDSYSPTILLTLTYLVVIKIGMQVMEGRKPLPCQWLIRFYNVSLVLLNSYIFFEVLHCAVVVVVIVVVIVVVVVVVVVIVVKNLFCYFCC